MREQRGFTLIELMVVLAVTGIMLSFGLPRLTAMLQSNRTAASLNSLSAHLNYARSEAVRRNADITVAALDPGFPAQWHRGWVVFVDTNNNGTLNALEQQLRVVEALSIPNFTITPTINVVTYNRLGAAPANAFTLQEVTIPATPAKTLSISVTGHVSMY